MHRRRLGIAAVVSLLVVTAAAAMAETRPRFPLRPASVGQSTPYERALAKAIGDTTIIARFDFEDGAGNADAQGWTSRDAYEQVGTFFHVDDFAGLGNYAPLSGARSMWLGVREGAIADWSGTGYGNYWHQALVSRAFSATGIATISCVLRYDIEMNYDFLYLEYRSGVSGEWTVLASYTGADSTSITEQVSSLDYGSSLQLRFRFFSDAAYSDEDELIDSRGAVLIDDLTVSSGAGIHDDEDFEGVAVGATTTPDGDWTAVALGGFGDYAGLFSGPDVVQEGAISNSSHFWGFFEGSPDSYACGGFPSQASVPVPTDPESIDPLDRIHDEIVSPWIDISLDENGLPYSQTDDYRVFADVYFDLPLAEGMVFSERVRWMVDGATTGWRNGFAFYQAGPVEWKPVAVSLNNRYVPGATHVQVALSVRYLGPEFNVINSGCTSQSPLIDNVRIAHVLDSSITVTNTNFSGVGSWQAAVDLAEASPDPSTILFDLPGPGPHELGGFGGTRVFTHPVSIQGFSQIGSSANTNPIDQPCNANLQVILPSGVRFEGGDSVLRGVVIHNSTVYLASEDNRVDGCYLGTDVTGTTVLAGDTTTAVSVSGVGNTVGGASSIHRNVIGTGRVGVALSGTNNLVIGNFIGVDATGVAALTSAYAQAIQVIGSNNQIGGAQASQRNVIHSSDRLIEITGDGADGNRVWGNYVGLNRTGTAIIPVAIRPVVGIAILEGDDNEIGGLDAGARNVVAGANYGAWILGDAGGNRILNNNFGTDATGSGILGFAVAGIDLEPTGFGNEVGGTVAGAGNVIAGAGGVGVLVGQGTTALRGNSIYANGGLGIDLNGDGITANDGGDVDSGPNSLQNFPNILGILRNGGSLVVSGILMSEYPDSYRIEYFASEGCDPSGNGEGQVYLGYQQVIATSPAPIPINIALEVSVPDGWWVTTTATDASGNTSEFSPCLQMLNTFAGQNVVVSPFDPTTGTQPVTLTFNEVTSDGNTTLVTNGTGPTPPEGYLLGDTYYDLQTDVSHFGVIEICISYDPAGVPAPEEDLRLLHYDESLNPPDWVDITTSLDTSNHIICGQTMGLSPFVLARADPATSVPSSGLPTELVLLPNVPNPFNPRTTIAFELAHGTRVTLRIYDVAGRLVATLIDGRSMEPGRYREVWDGSDRHGGTVASGVYRARLEADGKVMVRAMSLIR